MRVFAITLIFTAFIGGVTAETEDTQAIDLLITAHFPEENPFHHVVNGERNKLYLIVENKSEVNSTLRTVAGSFHDSESQALVKNISSMGIPVLSVAGTKFTVPFSFHSELKPGDYGLRLWVDYVIDDSLYRATAYDGIVTVVEPVTSIFDFKMISTYIISALIVLTGTYFAILSLFPSLSKPRRKRAFKPSEAETPASVGTVKANGGGYSEEWIPEHHLKKPTIRRGQKKPSGVLSSGDEKETISGAESPSSEGLRRSKRGKKA